MRVPGDVLDEPTEVPLLAPICTRADAHPVSSTAINKTAMNLIDAL